jgi:hypothetical protein
LDIKVVVSALAGGVVAILVKQVVNRRGLVTFCVEHSPLGFSTVDQHFGTVQVTWNNNPLANLFHSHVEVENVSTLDFENVEVRLYTDASMLTEKTWVEGSTHFLKYTEEFAGKIKVPDGQQATQEQREFFWKQRHYMLPVLNRGQRIPFNLLSTAPEGQRPNIWCDILHKGIKIKFRVRPPVLLGVPLKSVAWASAGLMLVFLAGVIAWVDTAWVAAMLVWAFGLVSLYCGALLLRFLRKVRAMFSD